METEIIKAEIFHLKKLIKCYSEEIENFHNNITNNKDHYLLVKKNLEECKEELKRLENGNN